MPLNIESQVAINPDGIIYLYYFVMTIGNRIRKLRELHNLSQERFGELCGGLSKGAISQWESDLVTPPVDRMLDLKRQMEFSLEWIYTGKLDIATEISQRLGVKERQAWYRAGRSLAEPADGTNGNE